MTDIYSQDLAAAQALSKAFSEFLENLEAADILPNHYPQRAELSLWHSDGYPVGIFTYADEQLRFTPHEDVRE